jgi:hypothetical protein
VKENFLKMTKPGLLVSARLFCDKRDRMSQIELDMLYGVRLLCPPSYSGIRIMASNLARKTGCRVKRWKRLNRPDKIKNKTIYIPEAYRIGNVIYAHPTIINRLNKA